MAQLSGSEPHALDRPWRTWASVVVLVILLSGVLLGVLIIPVVQGRGAGIDAFTAICRALGILPGSPAVPQIVDRTPPTPVSQVVWTPEVLRILADAKPERGRAKAQEVCVACHGEQGVSAVVEYPNLAGQSGAAIYKQLSDYRTGSRTNQLMTDIAKALDETTLADSREVVDLAEPLVAAVTDGAAPIRWHTRTRQGIAPTFDVEALDTTAAGDAFVGAWLQALVEQGLDATNAAGFFASAALAEPLRLAAAAGALATTRHGAFAAMPTRAQVEQLLGRGP